MSSWEAKQWNRIWAVLQVSVGSLQLTSASFHRHLFSAKESLVCFRLLHGFTTRQGTQQTYSRRFVAPVESGGLLLPVWLAGKAHSCHTWMGFPYVEQIKKPTMELYKSRWVWDIKRCQLQQEPRKCQSTGEAGRTRPWPRIALWKNTVSTPSPQTPAWV